MTESAQKTWLKATVFLNLVAIKDKPPKTQVWAFSMKLVWLVFKGQLSGIDMALQSMLLLLIEMLHVFLFQTTSKY